MSCPVQADERAILADIKAFFETTDTARRADLVHRIQSALDYERSRVKEYLDGVELFDELQPGRKRIVVSLPTGAVRPVVLSIPQGYSPARDYPLIYALHCGGCDPNWSIRFCRRLLAGKADQYVIAAPHKLGGADFYPYETPAVLLAIKKLSRIDSDRVYVTGYSAGGCGTRALAVLHRDEFAALVPIAGTLYIGQQTLDFLPNIANTYVLNTWGAKDSGFGWGGKADGGMAVSNRRLRTTVDKLRLPVDSYEDPNKGHGGVEPPHKQFMSALGRQRKDYPGRYTMSFNIPAKPGRTGWSETLSKVRSGPTTPLRVIRVPVRASTTPSHGL